MGSNVLFFAFLMGLVSCMSVGKIPPDIEPTVPLREVFEQRGLTMLSNPASDYIPGTLLYDNSTRQGKWLIACFAEKALPGIRNKISISNTSSFSMNLDKESSLDGNLSMIALASVAAEFRTQATITLNIANPVMLKIDHAALQGTSSDPTCVAHLNQKERDRLLLIMEALQADIGVTVKFDQERELSAEIKDGLL